VVLFVRRHADTVMQTGGMARARRLPRALASLPFKFAVTGGLLTYAFLRIDVAALSRDAGHADPGLLALAVAMLCLNYPLGGLRWWCVVRGLGRSAPAGLLIGLFWLGGLVGQFLPSPLGDTLRVWTAARRGMQLGTAVRSALFERLLMVFALLLLIAVTEPMLQTRVGAAVPTRIARLLLADGVIGLAVFALADLLLAPLRHLPLVGMVADLSAEFRRLLASPWSPAVYAALLLGHLNLIFTAGIVGAALALPLSAGDYLAIMPVATVATILPVSIGGWGVREGVLIAMLGTMGVPAEAALVFSLLYGLCIAASSLPALAFLWRRGDVHATARAAVAAEH